MKQTSICHKEVDVGHDGPLYPALSKLNAPLSAPRQMTRATILPLDSSKSCMRRCFAEQLLGAPFSASSPPPWASFAPHATHFKHSFCSPHAASSSNAASSSHATHSPSLSYARCPSHDAFSSLQFCATSSSKYHAARIRHAAHLKSSASPLPITRSLTRCKTLYALLLSLSHSKSRLSARLSRPDAKPCHFLSPNWLN